MLFLLTLVVSLRPDKEHEAFLSIESSKSLRGLLAVVVFFCHIYAYYPVGLSLRVFNAIGYIAVALFFLLAGYGLVISASEKKDYLSGFLFKRLSKLYIPLWISLVIVGLFSAVMGAGGELTAERVVRDILGLNAIWFFTIIILYYIVFYLVWRYVPTKFRMRTISAFVGLQCVACFAMNLNMHYYTSSFGFLLGMVLANEKEKNHPVLTKFDNLTTAKKTRVLFLLEVVTFCSLICYALYQEVPLVGPLLLRNAAGICLVLNIILILWYVKIGNRVSCFLGELSYEIFLVHPGVLAAIKTACGSKMPWGAQVALVIIYTIALSMIVHYLTARIFKLIRR